MLVLCNALYANECQMLFDRIHVNIEVAFR